MKKVLYLLLFSFTGLTTSAQELSAQLKCLSLKITYGINNDSLKVRAIYDWITDNISYDISLSTGVQTKTAEYYVETQKSDKVINRKKAICMGYTNLFHELCATNNIKSYIVSGYSKNLDPYTRKLVFSADRHSWIAVKINKTWYLCDPTWSAGFINVQTGTFNKQRNEEFYLCNGKTFIKRHLPLDPLWQLSDTPVSLNEFRYGLKPKTSKFNYLDTLKVFEMLTPEQQKLNAGFRSLNFDSSNDEAKSDIGFYFAKKAEIDSKAWHDLVVSFMNKNTSDSYRRAREEKDKVYQLLANIEHNMNQARYYYSLIPPTSQFSRMALNNVRNVDNYLLFIQKNRTSLTEYYDTLINMRY